MAVIDSSKIYSVTELTKKIKETLEDSALLKYVRVRGEISNFARRQGRFGSDNLYFTLKDKGAPIPVVMFEGVDELEFEPSDGSEVVCEGMVTVYEGYGRYQLKCYAMSEKGSGESAKELGELVEKLRAEGLFNQKRELPEYPKKIAVITSPKGAALQDIINVISRRYPITELCVIPAYVQGENAVPSIVSAIKRSQTLGADLIIFGRGGGSSEDLSCFNSEALAREIFASKIPTISAVGHETDLSIADWTADKRAPTPSAAAELAVPDISEILREIESLRLAAGVHAKRAVNDANAELELASRDVRLYSPRGRITEWENERARLFEGISNAVHRRLSDAENSLNRAIQSISDLNPLGVLARGYSLTEKDGRVVRSSGELSVGDTVEIRLGEGALSAKITEIKE